MHRLNAWVIAHQIEHVTHANMCITEYWMPLDTDPVLSGCFLIARPLETGMRYTVFAAFTVTSIRHIAVCHCHLWCRAPLWHTVTETGTNNIHVFTFVWPDVQVMTDAMNNESGQLHEVENITHRMHISFPSFPHQPAVLFIWDDWRRNRNWRCTEEGYGICGTEWQMHSFLWLHASRVHTYASLWHTTVFALHQCPSSFRTRPAWAR